MKLYMFLKDLHELFDAAIFIFSGQSFEQVGTYRVLPFLGLG